MKTEYKNDLKNNYLVVEPEEEVNSGDYDVRMLEQNRIQGFLAMQIRRLDGGCQIYYEITSMQQLDSLYEKKQLRGRDIRQIFSGIQDILESARNYLLGPQQILFDPQYMYVESKSGKISVCYLPVKKSVLSVLPLAEFLLKKLDHEDPNAVAMGYDFYQRISGPNFSLTDTLSDILAGTYQNSQEAAAGGDSGEKEEQREEEKRAEDARAEPAGRYDDRYEDFYEVQHRERRKNSPAGKKQQKRGGIFQAVHPAILILTVFVSAALGVLLYLRWLGLTETGGLFFIFLSVAILANRFWKNRRDAKGKKSRRELFDEEDLYPEEIQRSRESFCGYEREELFSEKTGYLGEERSDDRNRKIQGERRYEDEEKTLCIGMEEEEGGINLISSEPGRHPEIYVRKGGVVVGKKKGQADIILEEPAVSRIHARLEYRPGGCYVTDLNSRNGTYVNDVRLRPQEQTKIREGDRIRFADVAYQAVAEDKSEMTRLLR